MMNRVRRGVKMTAPKKRAKVALPTSDSESDEDKKKSENEKEWKKLELEVNEEKRAKGLLKEPDREEGATYDDVGVEVRRKQHITTDLTN